MILVISCGRFIHSELFQDCEKERNEKTNAGDLFPAACIITVLKYRGTGMSGSVCKEHELFRQHSPLPPPSPLVFRALLARRPPTVLSTCQTPTKQSFTCTRW